MPSLALLAALRRCSHRTKRRPATQRRALREVAGSAAGRCGAATRADLPRNPAPVATAPCSPRRACGGPVVVAALRGAILLPAKRFLALSQPGQHRWGMGAGPCVCLGSAATTCAGVQGAGGARGAAAAVRCAVCLREPTMTVASAFVAESALGARALRCRRHALRRRGRSVV